MMSGALSILFIDEDGKRHTYDFSDIIGNASEGKLLSLPEAVAPYILTSIGDEAAQALIDDLFRCGFRPSGIVYEKPVHAEGKRHEA